MKLVWTLLITGFLAVAAWADDLTLSADKPFYAIGERAVISGVISDTEMDFAADFGIQIRNADDGGDVLETTVEWEPEPGRRGNTWTWDLKDDQGRAVSPGTYEIYITGDFETYGYYFEGTIYVEVVPATRSGRLIVRTTKREYVRGEPVKFYAINRTNRARSLPITEPWTIFSQESDYPYFAPVAVAIAPAALEARGGRRMWSWDQKDFNGRQARNGRYTVEVTLGTVQRRDPYYRSFRIVN